MKKRTDNTAKQTLTEKERDLMKQEFLSFVDMYPVVNVNDTRKSFFFLLASSRASFGYAFASIVVMVFFGGILYASESALPHEPLYILKTGVTENLFKYSTSFSNSMEAWANTTLLERRLSEIRVLSQTTDEESNVMRNLTEEVKERTDDILSYATEEKDYTKALMKVAHLESILEGHVKVYESLTDDTHSTEDSESLVSYASTQRELATQLKDTLIEETTNHIETLEIISKEYGVVLEKLDDLQDKMSTDFLTDAKETVALRVSRLKEEAKDTFASSTEAIQSGDVQQAIELQVEALGKLEQAKIFITTESTIEDVLDL